MKKVQTILLKLEQDHATECMIDHLELETELHRYVTMAYYKADHMMYLKEESLAKMQQDLTEFLESGIAK
jgi:carboxypeptidase C (cathepsin A)